MLRPPPLIWRLWRGGRNGAVRLFIEQPARGLSVLLVIGTVWAFVFGLGHVMLAFLSRDQYIALKPRLLESLLGLFFYALFWLVAMSNMIVVWGSLFRTPSAVFHAQLPIGNRALFWGAAIEGGVWSSWAGLVLAVPLLGTLASEAAQPALYLPAALLTMICFLATCLCLGALGATLLASIIRIVRRHIKVLSGIAIIAAVAYGTSLLFEVDRNVRTVSFLREAISSISFTESPYLPPSWAQRSVHSALTSRWGDWLWHTGLLASTAATIALLGEWVAQRRLRNDLDQLTGRPEVRRKRSNATRGWRFPAWLPKDLAVLVAKDLRLFRRDPAQVLQFALYFGILAFYILLLPRIEQTFAFDQWWRPVVSLLNLTAVSMALATFTGRFVFPLLSYEGKRLWILVLAPWPRHRIVTAKFTFALAVGLPVSVGLVLLSGVLLGLPNAMVAYQGMVTAVMGIGLSAGSLGLGALLADYKEDDPGKLAAGYGGTINLLVSLVFVAALLVGAGFPLFAAGLPWRWEIGILWTLAIGGGWTWLGLKLAWSRFRLD